MERANRPATGAVTASVLMYIDDDDAHRRRELIIHAIDQGAVRALPVTFVPRSQSGARLFLLDCNIRLPPTDLHLQYQQKCAR